MALFGLHRQREGLAQAIGRQIRLDKGETLGGTAPLVLLDQVTSGGRRRATNKRGREGISVSAWVSTLISVSVLAGLLAAALNMVDWPVLLEELRSWATGTE